MQGTEESRLRDTLERIEARFLARRPPASGRRRPTPVRFCAGWKSSSNPIRRPSTNSACRTSGRGGCFSPCCGATGINPYRYPRQKYSTVMVRAPGSFIHDTLWPEFLELDKILCDQLAEITERLIAEAVFADSSEAAQAPQQLA